MATKVQRIKAIADALVNGTASTEQVSKLGRALALYHHRNLDVYDNSTAGEKAGISIAALRSVIFGLIRRLDKHDQEAALAALPDPNEEFNEQQP